MNCEEINQADYLKLAHLVIEKLTNEPFERSKAFISPLSTNYYSFVFFIELSNKNSTQKVFVKIPKVDLRKKDKLILPISPGDRDLAEAEVKSLKVLSEQWNSDDIKVSWVKIRAEIPEYNAIITDAAEGHELLNIFRNWDTGRRFAFGTNKHRLISVMSRIGQALARFHLQNYSTVKFEADQIRSKIEFYCRELKHKVDSSDLFEKLEKGCQILKGEDQGVYMVPTLKGIDIRNILIDQDDKVSILDPGRLKLASREADLSRFIMTYRILYWGSRLFLFIDPDKDAEKAFLKAYYDNSFPASGNVLHFYLIKEQLKHWYTAHESLEMHSYPAVVKRLLAGIYVNPYYIRQLTAELEKIN
jgi:hypothetical protein